MARFYVGQRVRIIKCEKYHQFLNAETHIVALHSEGRDKSGQQFFGIEIGIISPNNLNFVATPDQLEPILTEGHQPAEYSYTELMDRLRSGVAA